MSNLASNHHYRKSTQTDNDDDNNTTKQIASSLLLVSNSKYVNRKTFVYKSRFKSSYLNGFFLFFLFNLVIRLSVATLTNTNNVVYDLIENELIENKDTNQNNHNHHHHHHKAKTNHNEKPVVTERCHLIPSKEQIVFTNYDAKSIYIDNDESLNSSFNHELKRKQRHLPINNKHQSKRKSNEHFIIYPHYHESFNK